VPLPNFFLAGAPKAGTTSLYAYLQQHPAIYTSPIKEPMFFGADDLLSGPFREQFVRYVERNPADLRVFLRDAAQRPGRRYILYWEDYVRLFDRVAGETAIGEGSVDYLWLPSAAAAIHRRVPDARFIFVLRHPVEKVVASYVVALRYRPDLVFRDWFLAATHSGAPAWPIVDGARYATHLERFLGFFPREQIRIYLYDTFRADARAVIRDIFTFLNVAPDYPVDVSRRRNEGIAPRSAALHRFRRAAFGDRAPSRVLPQRARDFLWRFYYRPRGETVIDPDDRRMVLDYYQDEIARTETLLGRDLAPWRE